MILPGSYANGFAPRDGQPLYPELWRGCVGAWNPGLGPTGLTLRDWSGFGNHGTLTSMEAASDWVVSGGRYALDFDGSNDFVNCGTISRVQPGASPTTVTAWVYRRSGALGGVVGYRNAGQGWQTGWTAAGNAWVYTGLSAYESSLQIPLNTWTPVAYIILSSAITIHVANRSQSFTGVSKDDGTGFVSIGAWAGIGSPNALIDDVRIYNRPPIASEIKKISMRRGIAYELAPRRRASVQVIASFNRRRRLLIGAH
jgi:hypothetical protein